LYLPDKAIDLLDEGASHARMEEQRSGQNLRRELERELNEAVRESRYEKAAQLRDKMHSLAEKTPPSRHVRCVTEEDIARHLYTAHCPPPDLIVRTGGELRLSNFLMWQSAYAELYFTDVLWPDFAEADVDAAIAAFYTRGRRFGNVVSST
jgi:undecaprenyl diphosphate synthase